MQSMRALVVLCAITSSETLLRFEVTVDVMMLADI